MEKISSETKPYITPGSVVRTHVYQVSFTEPPDENRIAGTVSVVDPWFNEHVTELKADVETQSRIRAIPARVDLSGNGGAEASAEFLILTNAADSVPINRYKIDAEKPLNVEPISAKGGVASFRVTSLPPTGSDEVTRKITVRIPSIANESAVVTVTAKRAQP